MKLIRVALFCLIVFGLAVPQAVNAQGAETLYLPSISSSADVLLSESSMAVQAAAKKPLPPQSNAFGKTLAEWQNAYWTWFLTGVPASGYIGNVRLLPIPDGEITVELSSGSAFMLPVQMAIGEDYEDGTRDAKMGVEGFANAKVEVTLDGNPLLCQPITPDCDSKIDVTDYYTEGDFESPIVFDIPGVARFVLIWFEGLGFVHPPLSVGEHVLHLVVENDLSIDRVNEAGEVVDTFEDTVVFDNTWNITVVGGKKK